jgi:hypothetical protein
MKRRTRLVLAAAGFSATYALAACGSESPGHAATSPMDAGRDADSAHDEDAGERDAALPEPKPVCSADGFCWEQPLPQGESLRAVWAAGERDVWAVGDNGALLHYDGVSFRAEPMLTEHKVLRAVHGSAADDVWAVGDGGVVLHYDGGSWQATDLRNLLDASASAQASLQGVYAAAPDSVWAVGFSGVRALIAHYDGQKWQNQLLNVQNDQVLRAVWGLGKQRAWAVGDKGVVLSFDGAQWTADKSATQAALYAVHALDEQNVWAVGAAGSAVRWNGTTWAAVSSSFSGNLLSVIASLPMPLMAAGAAAPAPVAGNGASAGTSATAPTAPMGPWLTWAFGDKGRVFRYNGKLWAELPSGTDLSLYGAARLSRDTFLAVGAQGQISRFNEDAHQSLTQGSRKHRLGLTSDALGVWSVGDAIEHRDSLGWVEMQRPVERALYGVWADGKNAWAVGTAGSVLRWDGASWKSLPLQAAGQSFLHAVHGAAHSVWIVGDAGLTLTAAAGSFVKVTTPVKTNLLDVWGAADDQFWAVGDGGVVLRWDGMAWLKVPTGPMGGVTQQLRAVWGSAADDVWVVGAESTILHWNGERFESQSPGAKYTLNDVWGRARNDVFAVGSAGVLLHYDGNAWTALDSGTSSALQSVIGDAQGRLFLAGLDGTLLMKTR